MRPYLQEAWEEAQAAKKGAKEYGIKAPMRLNLAIMCTIAPALLIQLFSRFRAAHSDIQLDLIDGTAQSIEEQLIGAKAESAVYCWPDRARDPRLNYLPLFREQMTISVSIARRSIEATGTTGPGNDRQRLRLRVLSEILDFERVRRGQAFSQS